MKSFYYRLTTLCMLIAIIAGTAPLSAQQASVQQAQEEEAFYRLSFSAVAFGSEGDPSSFVIQNVSAAGRSTYDPAPYSPGSGGGIISNREPNGVIIHDQWLWDHVDGYSRARETRTLLDPQLYGYGNRFGYLPLGASEPVRRADGSSYIPDPFPGGFIAPGSYIYRTTTLPEGANEDTPGASFYASALQSPGDIEGDGQLFSKQIEFQNGFLTVRWNVKIERIGACKGLQGPIDGNDKRLKNVNVQIMSSDSMIAPAGKAKVKVRVTCEGVPVKNAEVKLAVKVAPRSGGHNHVDMDISGNPRPRGCLDGTKITQSKPDIKITTNDKGESTAVVFQAGTNDACGAERSLAGSYTLTASSTRFPNSRATRSIEVRRNDLTPLQAGSDYVIARGGAQRHPNGSWGTAATLSGITQLAADFKKIQETDSLYLGLYLQPDGKPWPLSINDISLQNGGLFDVSGWDIKQQQNRNNPWNPPHYSHLNGVGVDMNTAQWDKGSGRWKWLTAALRLLGRSYGRWAKEDNLHLDFNQTTYTSYNDVSLTQQAGLAANAPDLAVVAFPVGPADYTLAAPGLTVSYMLAFSNWHGTDAAHNVALQAKLPAGLSFVSSYPPPAHIDNNGQPVWEYSLIEAHKPIMGVNLVTRVDPALTATSPLTLTASISTADSELNLDNNSDEAIGLTLRAPGPDLIITTDLADTAMTIDTPVTAHVDLTNNGNSSAPNTILRLNLPDEVIFQSATPAPQTVDAGIVQWQLGTLEVQAARQITLHLTIAPTLTSMLADDPEAEDAYKLLFGLYSASDNDDINPRNNELNVLAPISYSGPDTAVWLGIGENIDSTAAASSTDFQAIIGYNNTGNLPNATSIVTLTLAADTKLISAQPAPAVTQAGFAQWNLGMLAPGESGIIQLQLQVSSTDEQPIVALIRGDMNEINPLNNMAMEYLSSSQVQSSTTKYIFLPVVINR